MNGTRTAAVSLDSAEDEGDRLKGHLSRTKEEINPLRFLPLSFTNSSSL